MPANLFLLEGEDAFAPRRTIAVLAECQGGHPVQLCPFFSRALPLLLVVAFMSPPVPAAAWAAPPSLNGESFTGTATIDASGCLLFTGTFGFSASGTASGAYPGPFSESGTVTISPTGSVTGFNVPSFTVTATSGPQATYIASGTKAWAPPAGLVGVCVDGLALSVNSTYRATITLPSGEVFCDQGTAVTNIGVSGPGAFSESFSSSLTTATPVGLSGTCP